MKTHKIDQGTLEWWELHRGRPTASNFDRIMTAKKRVMSSQADDYIAELVAQVLLPGLSMVPEGYMSKAMHDGIMLEPEARRWYEYTREVKVEQIGFCETDDGRFGCSPDALVSDDGALELKCPTPKTHVRYLMDQELPGEYTCQVHGELIVTRRKWVDFVSYCPGLPAFIVRVTPNDFTEALQNCLGQFWLNYDFALRQIKERA